VEEPESDQTVIQRRILLSFCATVFLGVILCVTYLAQRTMSQAPRQAVASNTTAVSHWTVLLLPAPPAPLPDSASPYAAEVAAVTPSPAPAPLKLEMSATEDAWVEVETDGHVTFAKLVRAEQTVSFEAVNRIRMSTGNALGLELRFNGEPVRLTSSRRVRTLEFTSDGPRAPQSNPPAAKS